MAGVEYEVASTTDMVFLSAGRHNSTVLSVFNVFPDIQSH